MSAPNRTNANANANLPQGNLPQGNLPQGNLQGNTGRGLGNERMRAGRHGNNVAGDDLGDERMQVDRHGNNVAGQGLGDEREHISRHANDAAAHNERHASKTSNYVGGIKDKAVGHVESGVSSITGNTEGRLKGETRKAEGEAKMSLNR